VWRGGALDAMGISVQTVCCRSPLNACLGSDRAGDEPSGWIAIGRSCIAQWRSSDKRASRGGARPSLIIARREPAKQKGRTAVLPRIDSDHDVSILITAVDAEGRVRGEAPRWNVSMMIMRPPQHGHGCESGLGSMTSAQL
jgi:hypothetical protein